MGNLRKLPKNWNLMFILSNGCVHFVTDSQSVICLSSLMFVVHICVCVALRLYVCKSSIDAMTQFKFPCRKYEIVTNDAYESK